MQTVTIEIDDLIKVGAIQDEPPYQLPPEAFSSSVNMRDFADGVELMGGLTQVFGSGALSDAPQFSLYVSGPTQPWWLWTSNTKAYVWDGATNTDITRVAGNYTATSPKQWNGTVFGGIPILNNGVDPPQFWNAYTTGTKLANLTNFPAATTCRVIRSFLSYLIALNITASGTNTPHLLMWSTEASPGNLPSTWNIADPTQDAGEVDLPDVISGQILDGNELNGQFMVYKESGVWRMSFIGGTFIWDFKSFLETAGLLATRCQAMTGDGVRHVFTSQDDMIIHNGITAESLLTKRFKRYLFNSMDTTHYDESFMFSNPLFDEIWFCYPLAGTATPNHALVWNYRLNTIREVDAGLVTFQSATIGNIPAVSGLTWAAATLTWEQDTSAWSEVFRRRVIVTNNVSNKLLQLNESTLNDGAPYTGTLERTGLSIIGRKRSGEWVEDFQRLKLIRRIWPKIRDGAVNVQVGYQQVVDGATTWGPVQAFDPTTQVTVDGVQGAGRATSIRFYAANRFRLDGYKIEMALLGQF